MSDLPVAIITTGDLLPHWEAADTCFKLFSTLSLAMDYYHELASSREQAICLRNRMPQKTPRPSTPENET